MKFVSLRKIFCYQWNLFCVRGRERERERERERIIGKERLSSRVGDASQILGMLKAFLYFGLLSLPFCVE
jgi:hypothetical protein